MSLYDYRVSKLLSRDDPPFAAIVMSAMRKADSRNTELLRDAWPEIWEELYARYHAPGGLLPGDRGYDQIVELLRDAGAAPGDKTPRDEITCGRSPDQCADYWTCGGTCDAWPKRKSGETIEDRAAAREEGKDVSP